MIGPFFYHDGKFIAHKIPNAQGELRAGKRDNPYSHEKLFDKVSKNGDFKGVEDYIYVPRGRVVWDEESKQAIIYTDICIENAKGAIKEVAALFELKKYVVDYDDHYRCPACMGEFEEE